MTNYDRFNFKNLHARAFATFLAFASTSPDSFAETEIHTDLIAADTFIEGDSQATSNFGDLGTLLIKNATNDRYTRQAILKYDLKDIGIASKITANLFLESASDAATINVHTAYGIWFENEVTWNTAPKKVELITSQPITTQEVGTWISFDVTEAALDAIDFDGELTLYFTSSESSSKPIIKFASKESSYPERHPSLTLTSPISSEDYVPPEPAPLLPADTISQFGITWHFSEKHRIGQYANGDYYVIENEPGAGVIITKIDPQWTTENGWHQHGSMVNPTSGTGARQGFDSSTDQWTESLNIEANLPTAFPAGTSVVSASSKDTPDNRPQLMDLAVLTIVSEAPPEQSFRPPYYGNDKTVRGSVKDLDYSILKNLNLPNRGINVPHLLTVTAEFERPWVEINTQWVGRPIHPQNNQPTYGREIAYSYSRGLLSLQLNYTEKQKENLFIRLVQHGIDLYGAAKNGANWVNNGGHNHGRKGVLLLAGKALNDSEILWYADAKNFSGFQEDQQTFYVTQREIDITNSSGWDPDDRAGPPEPYTIDHITIPEWGINHATIPQRDNAAWATSYRNVVGAPMVGSVLAIRIMELEEIWNHPALFDYIDRFWEAEKGDAKNSSNNIRMFPYDMWTNYRVMDLPESPANLFTEANY